jgi:cytochrome c
VRSEVRNPYTNDPNAIAAGKQLYIQMNCAYCHGFDGGGGMGPNLADDYWRFGGDDADIYKTIYEGRGQGMPAWGASLSESDIWKIIAYIRTLGGGQSSASRGGQAGGQHASANAQGGQGGGRVGTQRAQAGAYAQREPLKGRNINEP